MDIGFDPAKDARNIAHRSLSFARAVDFDWAEASISEDVRRDYPERRFVAVGYLDNRLHVLCSRPPTAAYGSSAFAKRTTERRRDMAKRKPLTDVDGEVRELTAADFKRFRPAAEVLPKLIGKNAAVRLLKPRGRPKSPDAKVSISLRIPPETLARWKASGPGWQTRMAEALARRSPRS